MHGVGGQLLEDTPTTGVLTGFTVSGGGGGGGGGGTQNVWRLCDGRA